MFLGVGIGDSLGRFCEGWTFEEVRSTFGRITNYIFPDGWPAGRKCSGSDETALTLAVSQGLLRSGGKPDIDAQVQSHVEAFRESTNGWGSTTYEVCRRLANGTPWKLAGERGGRITGVGNGAILKLAPTSLLLVENVPGTEAFIINLVSMTHQTSVAISAALAHANALAYCLQTDPASFNPAEFLETVVGASRLGRNHFPDTLTKDDITKRLLLCHDFAEWPPERCVAEFENGRNYVYHALPYTIMYFLRQPRSVEALYEIVSCGGDTDSTGSVLASWLAALNGTALFPPDLVDELEDAGRLVETANRLCDLFGIE